MIDNQEAKIEEIRSYLKIASNAELENNYQIAAENYRSARKMLIVFKSNESKFAFKCLVNEYKNLINQEKSFVKDLKVLIDDNEEDIEKLPYNKIIIDFFKDVKEIENAIFGNDIIDSNIRFFPRLWKRLTYVTTPPEPINHLKIISITEATSCIKELEQFLFKEGLEEQAVDIYKCYMRHKTELYRFYKRKESRRKRKFIQFFKEISLWLFDGLSKFGVSLARIGVSTLLIGIFFWILYSLTGTIEIQNNFYPKPRSANWHECLYYSVVTLLNIGSEVIYPGNPLGRFFEFLEAILGWAMLGMIISFITKRIK